MHPDIRQIQTVIDKEAGFAQDVLSEIGKIIVGQKHLTTSLMISLLTDGHVLLEGVPGLAKTLLISSIARATHLTFKRIQFTPDLMPADITGTDVLEEDHTTGKRVFRMAPIHHHFELKGWAEPKVIVRFWIITVILVLIGLASLKIR